MSLFHSNAVYVARKGEVLGDSFDRVAEFGARAILREEDGKFGVYLASHNQRGDVGWCKWTDDSYPTQFAAMIDLGIAYQSEFKGSKRWFFTEDVVFISGECP